MLSLLPNRRMTGFSLIELMIGIAVMAIVVSLSMPSYSTWIQNTKIRTASESIQNGIQIARAEAVKRNTPVQFDLRGASSAWTVCTEPAAPGPCPNPDNATTIQSRDVSEGSSTDIAVVTSDAAPFVFNNLGRMTSPAPAAGLVSIDVDNAALSTTDSRDLRITINPGGSTRMCDPNLPITDARACSV